MIEVFTILVIQETFDIGFLKHVTRFVYYLYVLHSDRGTLNFLIVKIVISQYFQQDVGILRGGFLLDFARRLPCAKSRIPKKVQGHIHGYMGGGKKK